MLFSLALRKLTDNNGNPVIVTLDNPEVESEHAWVLLGGPGSGKTTLFESESKRLQGSYVTTTQFLSDDWDNNQEPIFIDALDEAWIQENQLNILNQIRSKLKKLNNPKYRLACRAADWISSYSSTLAGDGPAPAKYILQPISSEMLSNNGVKPPHNIDIALFNTPLMLEMASKINEFHPRTKTNLYEEFCKYLSKELNEIHDIQKPDKSLEEILNQAGLLFTLLLLTNAEGITTKPQGSENFPSLSELELATKTMKSVISRGLFKPDSESRLIPHHRTIAEYLSGRYIGLQTKNGVSWRRVVTLFEGADKKTIPGLRGLLAWVAMFSMQVCGHLIETDPLTLLAHGDLTALNPSNMSLLLDSIQSHLDSTPGFKSALGDLIRNDGLPSVYSETIREAIYNHLEKLVNASNEDMMVLTLELLLKNPNTAPTPPLKSLLEKVIYESDYNNTIRTLAFKLWLRRLPDQEEIKTILNDPQHGSLKTTNLEILGMALDYAYPNHIDTVTFVEYLKPNDRYYLGMYWHFIRRDLEHRVQPQHRAEMLDAFASPSRSSLFQNGSEDAFLPLVSTLISQALEDPLYPVTNTQLFNWMMIGFDKYEKHNPYEQKKRRDILNRHPNRYIPLWEHCMDWIEEKHFPYLVNVTDYVLCKATPPKPLGMYHFERLTQLSANQPSFGSESKFIDQLVIYHFIGAYEELCQHTDTFQKIKDWVGSDPKRQALFNQSNQCDPSQDPRKPTLKENISKIKNTQTIQSERESILQGKARLEILKAFANAWIGNDFESWITQEAKDDIKALARISLSKYVLSAELPDPKAIITTYVEDQIFAAGRICLAAVEIIGNTDQVNALTPNQIEQIITFALAEPINISKPWFEQLAQLHPKAVAAAFSKFGHQSLKHNKDKHWTAALTNKQVIQIAVPAILKKVPTRLHADQLIALQRILKLALDHAVPGLSNCVTKQVEKKRGRAQLVLWLCAGFSIDPIQYEARLYEQITQSPNDARLFCDFFMRHGDFPTALTPEMIRESIKILGSAYPRKVNQNMGVSYLDIEYEISGQVPYLIQQLTTCNTTDDPTKPIRYLKDLSQETGLVYLKRALEHALYRAENRFRTSNYTTTTHQKILKILNNQTPTTVTDLQALILDALDDVAQEIKSSDANVYRLFFNIDTANFPHRKNENDCRDVLLDKLRPKLKNASVNLGKETLVINDNRVDIMAIANTISVPIEIKGEWNANLWSVASQIDQYTKDPNTGGLAIYLILWFGGSELKTKDGGGEIKTPHELKTRMQDWVNKKNKQITVYVLDVSWQK